MAHAEEAFESTRMTLGEHLEELRRRLFIGLGSILVIFLVVWFVRDEAARVALLPYTTTMDMLRGHYTEVFNEQLAADATLKREDFFVEVRGVEVPKPLEDVRITIVGPGEGFFFLLKVCTYVAAFLGCPILLWQVWGFVSAGLYRRERTTVLRYFPASVFLFVGGVLFGYFLLVPYGMYFLQREGSIEVFKPDMRAQEYFKFLSSLALGLGLVFQLPIVMTLLAKLDIVRPEAMSRYRAHTLVGAVILAAFLTPPDPYTQAMMAVPIVLLYEVGIWCARMAAPPPLTP